MASARSDFDPATTASPAARISAASSRPCRDIHTLCHVSISTAKPRMPALNTSWPLPPNSSDNPPVNSATKHAPNTPAATPPATQKPRPATPAVTAITMPTIRPASKTSRKTINSAASTGTSRHYQITLRLMVKIVVEIVTARLLRPHIDDALAADRDDLLEMQVAAFELGHDRIEILDVDGDGLTGRRMQFGGIELVILDRDRERHGVIRPRIAGG